MAVIAHPDDEFACAGLLQRYKSLGYKTHLVCATKGEAGSIRNAKTKLLADQSVSEIRVAEVEESCRHLGIDRLHFLNLIDGESSSWKLGKPQEMLMELIRDNNVKVVISFDENGLNGHPDHIATTKIVKSAVINLKNVGLVYITKYPNKFISQKLKFFPKWIKQNVIKQACVNSIKVGVLELDRTENYSKLKLLQTYSSQFPDSQNRYYRMPKFIVKRFSKYEAYEAYDKKTSYELRKIGWIII